MASFTVLSGFDGRRRGLRGPIAANGGSSPSHRWTAATDL